MASQNTVESLSVEEIMRQDELLARRLQEEENTFAFSTSPVASARGPPSPQETGTITSLHQLESDEALARRIQREWNLDFLREGLLDTILSRTPHSTTSRSERTASVRSLDNEDSGSSSGSGSNFNIGENASNRYPRPSASSATQAVSNIFSSNSSLMRALHEARVEIEAENTRQSPGGRNLPFSGRGRGDTSSNISSLMMLSGNEPSDGHTGSARDTSSGGSSGGSSMSSSNSGSLFARLQSFLRSRNSPRQAEYQTATPAGASSSSPYTSPTSVTVAGSGDWPNFSGLSSEDRRSSSSSSGSNFRWSSLLPGNLGSRRRRSDTVLAPHDSTPNTTGTTSSNSSTTTTTSSVRTFTTTLTSSNSRITGTPTAHGTHRNSLTIPATSSNNTTQTPSSFSTAATANVISSSASTQGTSSDQSEARGSQDEMDHHAEQILSRLSEGGVQDDFVQLLLLLLATRQAIRNTTRGASQQTIEDTTTTSVFQPVKNFSPLPSTRQATLPCDQDTKKSPCCVVCMCELEEGDLVRQLPCDHVFHVSCVDQWLKRNQTCPICRWDITIHPTSPQVASSSATAAMATANHSSSNSSDSSNSSNDLL